MQAIRQQERQVRGNDLIVAFGRQLEVQMQMLLLQCILA
jgi:hypothetical protein